MTSAAWRPLFAGSLAEQARAAALRVVADLAVPSERTHTHAHEVAVLHAYGARVCGDESAWQRAARFLEQAVARAAADTMRPTLFDGLYGFAWCVDRIAARDEVEAALAEVDDRLTNDVRAWSGPLDLIGGLTGLATYALARGTPKAIGCLSSVVRALRYRATFTSDGRCFWRTEPRHLPPARREQYVDGYTDLGIAHGQAGIIALLARLLATGVERADVDELLRASTAWLRRQQRDAAFAFTGWIAPNGDGGPARDAWCYGLPGIAFALLDAADALGDSALHAEAIALARLSALRPIAEAGVVDACLCHGAAGLGHAFNRLFQRSGTDEFRVAAMRWFERALELERQVGASTPFAAMGNDGCIDDVSICGGSTGVALALLAATTDIEPEWDDMMLMRPLTVRLLGRA